MDVVLADAGRAALKTFFAALIPLAAGFWVAPDLNGTIALGIAALMAGVAAVTAGLQVLWPALAIRTHVAGLMGALLDAFVHAFSGAFLLAITGWLAMPDYATWKSVLLGAFVGGLNAAFRAIQGALTPGEKPAPGGGVKAPRRALRDDGLVMLPA